jgi:hypothetical protein
MKTLKTIEVRNFFDGIAASLLAISNQSVRYQQWRKCWNFLHFRLSQWKKRYALFIAF